MSDLLSHYSKTRAHTKALCKPLVTEDYIPQPVEFVSPPKWHLAHTTWFFEEFVLNPHYPDYQLFHDKFSYLFNSYYNHVGARTVRANRGNMTRPTVAEVYAYRRHVDEHMAKFIPEIIDNTELVEVIILGINHEHQHQELLITDLKYTLSLNPLFPVYQEGYSLVSDLCLKGNDIEIAAGNYEVGAVPGSSFTFDNEHQRHQVYLHRFKISAGLVTNGEYLEFLDNGGYEKFQYWHDEALHWLAEEEISKPLYWHNVDGKWYNYTLAGLKEIDPEASLAHISFYEANAYANWKGLRLPTEEEWEVASDQFTWGQRWEWTQSAYTPYPGFKIAEGAIGEYNGKFMVNQMVLRGGSRATYPGHSRATYRNFFHPHLRWQLTGIRLVADE
jgi:ergothioneine biosynthesis protein EgtB